jgi:2-succinyl-5-enolpyruvyl-6-hydroxy-3-cyclohexene-1-carboxylate synthase
VDEWVRSGITDAVIAPGSRNTPLVLALAAEPRLRSHVVLDERSAGFVALGLSLAQDRPAVVVTTSGTAAAELHAAVVEAHQAGVPLVVCTADRPPELQQVGAPQTIDQSRLYGPAVRFFADPGPPEAGVDARTTWRSLASRVVLEATGARPGPVHLNLPFREPLVGPPAELSAGRTGGLPWHRRAPVEPRLAAAGAAELAAAWSGRRGLFVAGRGVDDPVALLGLAERLGWPVLAEPRSGCRLEHPNVVAHADALLRDPDLAGWLRPDVVVGVGEPPASKVVAQWLAGSNAARVLVDPAGRMLDPERTVGLLLEVTVRALRDALLPAAAAPPAGGVASGAPHPAGADWSQAWRAADDAAARALDGGLAAIPAATEPGAARMLLRVAAPGDAVVASSSMPVRDLEWYGPRRTGVRVFANRGANGIDGVVSTAVGVALGGTPTWLLIGDLALLHDANGLLGCRGRPLRLRLVVIDNAGGGIFSFLPQASALPAGDFERFFGTPQAVDIAELLGVHRIPTIRADTAVAVASGLDALACSSEPVAALVVRTDRAANVADHQALNAAMAAAGRRAVTLAV